MSGKKIVIIEFVFGNAQLLKDILVIGIYTGTYRFIGCHSLAFTFNPALYRGTAFAQDASQNGKDLIRSVIEELQLNAARIGGIIDNFLILDLAQRAARDAGSDALYQCGLARTVGTLAVIVQIFTEY